MELDSETLWNARAIELARKFSVECRETCDEKPDSYLKPLTNIMIDTMAELWDFGFSQTEIRQAFSEAIADLPRYAAGEERRT